MKKVIEFEWVRRNDFEYLTAVGTDCSVVTVGRDQCGFGCWSSAIIVDDSIRYATLDEAKAAAEASLGVQTVPAVPLRWVEQDDGGAKLTLGDVSIAEVYTPIDDADAVWYAESEHRIAPRNSDFPDRATAMRAVEAAFGITAQVAVVGWVRGIVEAK